MTDTRPHATDPVLPSCVDRGTQLPDDERGLRRIVLQREAFLPLLACVLTFLIGLWLQRMFVTCDIWPWLARHCPKVDLGSYLASSRPEFDSVALTTQLAFAAAFTLSAASSLAAFYVSTSIFSYYACVRHEPSDQFGPTNRTGLRAVRLGATAVVIVTVFIASTLPTGAYSTLSRQLAYPALNARVRLPLLQGLMNGLPIAAGLLVTFAVCAVLTKRARGKEATRALIDQIHHLQVLLYTGALVLVTGMLTLSAFLRWPSAYVEMNLPTSAHVVEQIAAIATAFTTLSATFYAVLLAAIFGPAWAIIHSRALAHAAGMLPGAPRPKLEEWLENENVAVSPWRRIANLLAVLSPVLVGLPVSAIVEAVKP